MGFTAAIITVSDSGFRGERVDASGDALAALLREEGASVVSRAIVPDERDRITAALLDYCGEGRVDLIITAGGTGMAPRDVTPEATLEVIDRQAPGFVEAIRAGSLPATPRAMLSRAVSGIRGDTLIINFPGSPQACVEAFALIRPALQHGLEILRGDGGQCAR